MLRDFLTAFPRFEIDEAAGVRAVSEFQVGWTSLPVRRSRPEPDGRLR